MTIDEQLEKLEKLKNSGALTEEEYAKRKEMVQNSIDEGDEALSCLGYFKRSLTKKYFSFKGRARRKEYWGYCLWNIIIIFILYLLVYLTKKQQIMYAISLYSILTIIPGLAITVRRLHDKNMSGWWLLAYLVPFVNLIAALYIFVITLLKSDMFVNKYGKIPAGVN